MSEFENSKPIDIPLLHHFLSEVMNGSKFSIQTPEGEIEINHDYIISQFARLQEMGLDWQGKPFVLRQAEEVLFQMRRNHNPSSPESA